MMHIKTTRHKTLLRKVLPLTLSAYFHKESHYSKQHSKSKDPISHIQTIEFNLFKRLNNFTPLGLGSSLKDKSSLKHSKT